MKKRFSEEQIIGFLREAEAGVPVKELCRKYAKRWERHKASVRAKVEHPFRVVKQQFGYIKVRYRGLAKNAAQMYTLFALSNLWMARKRLLPVVG